MRTRKAKDRSRLIQAAMGQIPCDLTIGNVQFFNVITGEIYPAFPNATYWVSRKQWDNFLHPNALEKDSYFIENMKAIADNGQLRLIDTDTELCPDIDLQQRQQPQRRQR